MLGWALTFLAVAIVAAVLGFGGVTVASAGLAQILFAVFLVLFLATVALDIVRHNRPPAI